MGVSEQDIIPDNESISHEETGSESAGRSWFAYAYAHAYAVNSGELWG